MAGKQNPLIENGRSTLTAAFAALALHIQEAAEMPHSAVRDRLQKSVRDAHKGTNSYGYYIDHDGDGESGNCFYMCDGELKSCPYEISDGDETASTSLDTDGAFPAVASVSYLKQADDQDHYARMSEGFVRDRIYDALPLYERFISKSERDSIADEDFAGKNRSFPIKTQADVDAAFHAIGRAGPDNYSKKTIRANIIKIATRKGFTLPKSAQTEASESAASTAGSEIKLVESAGAEFLSDIKIAEAARSSYPVKLISPGTGTMAHYPAAVLERDGPKVFKKGTLMFWNHPTKAEESARPEGDLNNLAAILTSDAKYDVSGAKGPGLYAEAKVMADYAQKIEERAPHIGLSIRAGGKASGKFVDGKPELKSIDYAESVDYVTKAGRGGLALAEAARDAGLLPAIEAAKPTKECPKCSGSGECPTCDGTGKVAKASEAKAKGSAKPMQDCSDCKGSGDCPSCDGAGKVMESAALAAPNQGEGNMDEATVQRLIESAVSPLKTDLEATKSALAAAKAENKPLLERALQGDARQVATDALQGLALRESGKAYVIDECLKGSIPIKDGKLDAVAFKESVTQKAKDVAAAFGAGAGRPVGMGISPISIDPKEAEAKEKELTRLRESSEDVFATLMGGNKAAAKAAVNKGVAA